VTPPTHARAVHAVPVDTEAPATGSAPEAGSAAPDLAAWNRSLNQTHAMAAMRARAGVVVNAIEARRRRLMVDAVLRDAPKRVIDVGCEDGWIAEGYAERVQHLVLSDIDANVLEQSPLATRPHVDTIAADATAPHALVEALGAAWADVIVLSALLEHVPEPRAVLRGLHPLLAPGGRFVIYLPADRPIGFFKDVLRHTRLGGLVRGLSLEPAPGHLHVFGRRDVVALTRRFGVLERVTFDPICLGWIVSVRRR